MCHRLKASTRDQDWGLGIEDFGILIEENGSKRDSGDSGERRCWIALGMGGLGSMTYMLKFKKKITKIMKRSDPCSRPRAPSPLNCSCSMIRSVKKNDQVREKMRRSQMVRMWWKVGRGLREVLKKGPFCSLLLQRGPDPPPLRSSVGKWNFFGQYFWSIFLVNMVNIVNIFGQYFL